MRVWQLLRSNLIFALLFRTKVEYGWVFYALLSPLIIVTSQHKQFEFSLPAWWVVCVWLTLTTLGSYLLTNTCLKVVRDTKRMRLPSSLSHIVAAQVIGNGALIVIPSIFLIAFGHAWVMVLSVTFFSLLGSAIPLVLFSRPWILGFNAGTWLFAIPLGIASAVGVYKAATHPEHSLWYLSIFFLLIVGLSLWHWQIEFTTLNRRGNIFQASSGEQRTLGDKSTFRMQWQYSPVPVAHYSRTPTTTIRAFLGKPLAPMRWREHAAYASSLLLIIIMPPLFMAIGRSELSVNGLLKEWNTLWPFSLYATSILAWTIYMKPVTEAFKANGRCLSELALLPKIGSNRKTISAFLRALFGRVAGITFLLLCFAEVSLYQIEKYWTPKFDVAPGLILAVVAIGLFTTHCTTLLQAILGNRSINTPEKRRQQLINALWVFPISQDWMWLSLFFTTSLIHTVPFSSTIRWLIPLIFLIVSVLTLSILFKLSRRPHPFVEV